MFNTMITSKGTATAKACFKENLRLFGDSKSQPEKFNLYNGLVNLTTAIEDIKNQVDRIESQLRRDL